MRPSWPRLDKVSLDSLKQILQRALLELDAMLRGGLTFTDNFNAAIVTFDAQTAVETVLTNPLRSKPIGLIPLRAMAIPAIGGNEDGTQRKLSTTPQLDTSRTDGFLGVTVDFAAGTYGRVTGILVGG